MLITSEQLNRICPSIKDTNLSKRATIISDLISKICPLYGIDRPTILHEWLANVLEESGEFTVFAEDLYYSAKRLMKVWPKRFPDMQSAIPYAKNPQKLAEKVYANRNGNKRPGDAYLMRGAGPMQLTGLGMIAEFTTYYNKKFGTKYNPYQMAEMLRKDLEIGIHSAAWVFAVVKRLIPYAISDNMKVCVYKINGGYTNMGERMIYYERSKQVIK